MCKKLSSQKITHLAYQTKQTNPVRMCQNKDNTKNMCILTICLYQIQINNKS